MAWKTGRVKIELNRPGVRAAALTSAEVRAALKARAERVQQAAQGRYDAIGVGVRDKSGDAVRAPDGEGQTVHVNAVVIEGGVARANARVLGDHPAALAIEAKHRVLGHSVDAAGD